MLVPNSQLLERTIVNWTLVDKQIRTNIRVGVEYAADVRLVAELILQAVSEQKEVPATPEVSIIFEDFGDSALIFDAYFWCEVVGERLLRQILSDIRFRACDKFRQADVVIAFPQRGVHMDFKEALTVRVLENPERDNRQNRQQ